MVMVAGGYAAAYLHEHPLLLTPTPTSIPTRTSAVNPPAGGGGDVVDGDGGGDGDGWIVVSVGKQDTANRRIGRANGTPRFHRTRAVINPPIDTRFRRMRERVNARAAKQPFRERA